MCTTQLSSSNTHPTAQIPLFISPYLLPPPPQPQLMKLGQAPLPISLTPTTQLDTEKYISPRLHNLIEQFCWYELDTSISGHDVQEYLSLSLHIYIYNLYISQV